jgi:hypothetical protein
MRTPTAFRADPEGPKATKPIPLALENHPSAFYRASLHERADWLWPGTTSFRK